MKAYQLKITVKGSKPPVWRRIIVPAGLSFAQLSVVINEVMGWCGYHLYSFTFQTLGLRFEEEPEDYGGWDDLEPLEASDYIIDHFLEGQKSFTYTYDFGDYWTHTVAVEKIIVDYKDNYPVLLKYKGSNYPEDCGGVWGYEEHQRILNDPGDEEYENLKEWYENSGYTTEYDMEEVNDNLQGMKLLKKKKKPMSSADVYQQVRNGKSFSTIQGKMEYEEDDYDDNLINFMDFHQKQPREKEKIDVLVVVDMQNDFIDGTLGTAEARAIVGRVEKKIREFSGLVLFTKDTHEKDYLKTQEGRKLPVKHCIRGTNGWALHPSMERLASEEENVIEKPTFGSPELGISLLAFTEDYNVTSVTLVGLCTDICVISNALLIKSFLPEVPIIVDSSCCAGVTPESHEQALHAMEMCQIEVI